MECSIVGADEDEALVGQGGSAVDIAVELERPTELAVGLERVQAIVLRTEEDRAVCVDDGGGGDAIGGTVAEPERAGGGDGVELAVEGAHVDGAVRAERG